VLVTALLFLVVLALLGIGLFRSSGLTDRISSNTRDKDRAFEAAQGALQYAEWLLASGTVGTAAACTGLQSGNVQTNVHVCSNALASASDAPWANGFTYTPPNVTISAGGGVVSDTNPDVNYSRAPMFYIEALPAMPDGTPLYQVTAAGFGGSASARAVVRSTFAVGSSGGPNTIPCPTCTS
jgi:type IV pilus assembly protein PilX